MAQTQWEYAVLTDDQVFQESERERSGRPEAIGDGLTALGAVGWRVVHVSERDGAREWVLERPGFEASFGEQPTVNVDPIDGLEGSTSTAPWV